MKTEFGCNDKDRSYTHIILQADSKENAGVCFIGGKVPEVGDEVKFVVSGSEQVDDRYMVSIDMQVVPKAT